MAETKGAPLHDLKYPLWVVVLVLTLLAHGCPIAAIVAAFLLDERTVLAWQGKAGAHAEQIQATGVCNGGLELGQVQADELCVNTQHGMTDHFPLTFAVFVGVYVATKLEPRVGAADGKLMVGLAAFAPLALGIGVLL